MLFFKFVKSSTTGIVTRFGRHNRVWQPGLKFFIPFVERYDLVCNRTKVIDLSVTVKTKDNAFVKMAVAVQKVVLPEDSVKAYWMAADTNHQTVVNVENAIRSSASNMTMDCLFESQDYIANSVLTQVAKEMKTFGITVQNTFVNNIEPSASVTDAMNQINASERLKIAAKNEADAQYYKQVRQAEADRERKRLQGEGISLQRTAIIQGYNDALCQLADKTGLTAQEVCQFVRQVQHLDVLEGIGRSDNTKTLFMNVNNPQLDTYLAGNE